MEVEQTNKDEDLEFSKVSKLQNAEKAEHDIEIDYVPLSRPPDLLDAPDQMTNTLEDGQVSDSDEGVISDSSSDSDDSDKQLPRSKRPKITRPPDRSHESNNTRNKKYSIWTSRAQEDSLAETLNSVDVAGVDRSRAVETYDFQRRVRDNSSRDNSSRNSKRTYSDRSDKSRGLGKRAGFDAIAEDVDCKPRYLRDAKVNESSSVEQVAKELAENLKEAQKELLALKVRIIGAKKALELYRKTQTIEADGGMLIVNQSRRRTPGGVFFHLLKFDSDITDEQREQMSHHERLLIQCGDLPNLKQPRKKKKNRKRKKPQNRVEPATSGDGPGRIRGQSMVDDSDEKDTVSNPPPSPVTDGKDDENMESDSDSDSKSSSESASHPKPSETPFAMEIGPKPVDTRELNTYDDDFLELMPSSGDLCM